MNLDNIMELLVIKKLVIDRLPMHGICRTQRTIRPAYPDLLMLAPKQHSASVGLCPQAFWVP